MYSKKKPINELKEGDRVEDIFVVKIKRVMLPYKNKSGYYFSLVLSDSSGRSIECKYWGKESEDNTKMVYDSIKGDSVVFVQGRVENYGGKLQISANPPADSIRTLSEGEYDPNDFIMPARRDIERMVKELNGYIESIQNTEIRSLLNKVFQGSFLEKFKVHPGSIEIHHNWTGGLLQHTLEVVKYSDLSKNLFNDMDRDLLIAGAILHDIGKIEEIEVTTRIKGTRKGQLKGHIPIGFRMVSKIMDELKTSENVRDKLLHIILSHHGCMEQGSPKAPMLPEAVAVYYADELSSKLAEITDFIKGAKDATEDEFMYNRRQGRNILLK